MTDDRVRNQAAQVHAGIPEGFQEFDETAGPVGEGSYNRRSRIGFIGTSFVTEDEKLGYIAGVLFNREFQDFQVVLFGGVLSPDGSGAVLSGGLFNGAGGAWFANQFCLGEIRPQPGFTMVQRSKMRIDDADVP